MTSSAMVPTRLVALLKPAMARVAAMSQWPTHLLDTPKNAAQDQMRLGTVVRLYVANQDDPNLQLWLEEVEVVWMFSYNLMSNHDAWPKLCERHDDPPTLEQLGAAQSELFDILERHRSQN